jgi:DNA (cytosine-5)-methyltransferase 1
MAEQSDLSWHLRAEQLVAAGPQTLISAGFPCQDISLAGKGAGLAGERSGLVWPLLRTIRLVRPRYALLENVAALLGRGLAAILGRMAEIGYDAEWHCIPASAVGAPHQRDRLWIIAADAGSEQYESDSPPLSGSIASELSRAFADTYGSHVREQPVSELGSGGASVSGADGSPEQLADTQSDGRRSRRTGRLNPSGARQFEQSLQDVSDARCEPAQIQTQMRQPTIEVAERSSWWATEPNVGRVVDGVPARMDRLKALGNAVVPQIPEIIGRAIMTSVAVSSDDRRSDAP